MPSDRTPPERGFSCGACHLGLPRSESLDMIPPPSTCPVVTMPHAQCARSEFDPPLDAGIASAVLALREHGVDTFESCEGGPGHAYPEPTVRFHGDAPEGFRALAAAMKAGLPVAELRRVWPIQDKEPTGPWWELTLATLPTTAP